jgi:hypothetical protein
MEFWRFFNISITSTDILPKIDTPLQAPWNQSHSMQNLMYYYFLLLGKLPLWWAALLSLFPRSCWIGIHGNVCVRFGVSFLLLDCIFLL